MTTLLRDWMIVVLMAATGVWIMLSPPVKQNMQTTFLLPSLVPSEFLTWKSITYDTKDFKDEWQSINELLARTYTKQNSKESVDFLLEYSSDVRRAFSFHFPEDCYRAGGNEVIFLDPILVKLSNGKILQAKCIFIKGIPGQREEFDKLVVYWLVLEGKQIHNTLGVKIDQMLAGLMSQARTGFLVRVDVREGFKFDHVHVSKAKDVITEFIQNLYEQLNNEQKDLLFGQN